METDFFKDLNPQRLLNVQRNLLKKKLRRVTLSLCLREPLFFNAFKRFLEGQKCPENLLFLRSVDVLQRLAHVDYDTLVMKAQSIWNQYLRDGSTFEVFVPGDLRETIKHKVESLSKSSTTNHLSTSSTNFYSCSLTLYAGHNTHSSYSSFLLTSSNEKEGDSKPHHSFVSPTNDGKPFDFTIFDEAFEMIFRDLKPVFHNFMKDEIYLNSLRNLKKVRSLKAKTDMNKHLLTARDIKFLTAFGKQKKVKKGELLIEAKKSNYFLYILEEGELEIFDGNSNSVSKVMKPNTIIGEISFFSSNRATTSVVVRANTTVWKIHIGYLYEVFVYFPTLAIRFYASLGKKMASILRSINCFWSNFNVDELSFISTHEDPIIAKKDQDFRTTFGINDTDAIFINSYSFKYSDDPTITGTLSVSQKFFTFLDSKSRQRTIKYSEVKNVVSHVMSNQLHISLVDKTKHSWEVDGMEECFWLLKCFVLAEREAIIMEKEEIKEMKGVFNMNPDEWRVLLSNPLEVQVSQWDVVMQEDEPYSLVGVVTSGSMLIKKKIPSSLLPVIARFLPHMAETGEDSDTSGGGGASSSASGASLFSHLKKKLTFEKKKDLSTPSVAPNQPPTSSTLPLPSGNSSAKIQSKSNASLPSELFSNSEMKSMLSLISEDCDGHESECYVDESDEEQISQAEKQKEKAAVVVESTLEKYLQIVNKTPFSPVRLETITNHLIFGEASFFLGVSTDTVVCQSEEASYQLIDLDGVLHLAEEYPRTAVKFFYYLCTQLANKIAAREKIGWRRKISVESS